MNGTNKTQEDEANRLIDELKRFFGVSTAEEAIKRALAVARAANKHINTEQ